MILYRPITHLLPHIIASLSRTLAHRWLLAATVSWHRIYLLHQTAYLACCYSSFFPHSSLSSSFAPNPFSGLHHPSSGERSRLYSSITKSLLMTAGGAKSIAGKTSSIPASTNNAPLRGAFIVLEGVDRCGKTTQVSRLVEALRAEGLAVEGIRFPDRTTTIGQMINAYLSKATDLDDHAIHLLFSANRWEAMSSLKAKLAAGTTLVCDRYAYSGVAFSAAKKGIDFDWCKECDRGLPSPDAVLYLNISVEDAAKRGQYGEERYETQEIQGRVRENFEKLMAGDPIWHVIDAAQPIDEVTKAVTQIALSEAKKAATRGPLLKTLWPGIDGDAGGLVDR